MNVSMRRLLCFAALAGLAAGCQSSDEEDWGELALVVKGLESHSRQERLQAEFDLIQSGMNPTDKPEVVRILREFAGGADKESVAAIATRVADRIEGTEHYEYFNNIRFESKPFDPKVPPPTYVNHFDPNGLEVVYRIDNEPGGKFKLQLQLFRGEERSRFEKMIGTKEEILAKYPFISNLDAQLQWAWEQRPSAP